MDLLGRMKHAAAIAIGFSASVLLTSTLLTAARDGRPAAPQQVAASAQEDPSYPLFTQMCNKCHDAARITAQRRNKFEWEEVINKMIEKGAMGTEKDFETVYDFLLRNFGKVDVNRAAAEEIAMVLALPSKDAEAIVAYRKANGSFADYDAVAKVPGIDVKKLEIHKDALTF
jgi:competence ComEA-like helix-hairpin-helix protein